ncbi:uncharacterized protein METZ01_LOCUS101989, partial [marine metagenome]
TIGYNKRINKFLFINLEYVCVDCMTVKN